MSVVDLLGRPLRDLRVSVTDNCNFRCSYCLPAELFPADYPFLSASELLSFPEIVRVVEAARPLGLKKVKITGGEPLLRGLLPNLVKSLKTQFPDLEVGLITNGLHLQPLLSRFRSSGLDSVTVSIDTLDPAQFSALSGNGHRVETILRAIEATREVFGTVKLNTVLLKGENDDQVEPMARYFRRPGFNLRFIEFMDVGTLNAWSRERMVSGAEVLTRLQSLAASENLGELIPLPKSHPGETSERWAWPNGNGELGFINSITKPFCGDCSRVRLGADGRLYTCLFASKGYDLRSPLRAGESSAELSGRLAHLWSGRSDQYSESRHPADQPGPESARIEMFAVGG